MGRQAFGGQGHISKVKIFAGSSCSISSLKISSVKFKFLVICTYDFFYSSFLTQEHLERVSNIAR